MDTRKLIPCLAVMLLLAMASGASAVTIETHFIGGRGPSNAVGGGNLNDIVRAAAHMWEAAYADPVTLTIYYGWGPSTDAGTHTLLTQGYSPNREVSGLIIFDNSGSTRFYLDPTPYTNEEYRGRTDEYQDLGGGLMNVARIFRTPTDEAAANLDLFSVALHEIGHALGMSTANLSFTNQCARGLLIISRRLPFSGAEIPISYNNFGIVSHFDALEITYGSVMTGINAGERRVLSGLDIIANAQLSGFTIANLNVQQPYPADVLSETNTRLQIGLTAPVPAMPNSQIIRKKADIQNRQFRMRLFTR